MINLQKKKDIKDSKNIKNNMDIIKIIEKFIV